MTRRTLTLFALVASVVSAVAAQAPAPLHGATTYRVLVNPHNPVGAVTRGFLADAFFKRATRWPDGELIKPADLGRASPVRRSFSTEVLGRSLQATRSYWQQQIFSGRELPPPEFDSDEAVVSFVLKYPGAIGYVSAGADLRAAKVVTVK